MTIVLALLSAFFLFAAFLKITGRPEKVLDVQMQMIRSYGLTREQFRLIGIVEGIAAIIIWFGSSWLGMLGALMILGTSAGAIFFHLRFGIRSNETLISD